MLRQIWTGWEKVCERKWEKPIKKKRLRIVFNHLERFPRMKYNNLIITNGIWVWKKPKNYKQLCIKTSMGRWAPCKLHLTDFKMLIQGCIFPQNMIFLPPPPFSKRYFSLKYNENFPPFLRFSTSSPLNSCFFIINHHIFFQTNQ